jgi:hypothetical protein
MLLYKRLEEQCLIIGHFIWDLWRTDWYWNRIFSSTSSFSCQNQFTIPHLSFSRHPSQCRQTYQNLVKGK